MAEQFNPLCAKSSCTTCLVSPLYKVLDSNPACSQGFGNLEAVLYFIIPHFKIVSRDWLT